MRLLIAAVLAIVLIGATQVSQTHAGPPPPPCPTTDPRCSSMNLGRGNTNIQTDQSGIVGLSELVKKVIGGPAPGIGRKNGQPSNGNPVIDRPLSPRDQARVAAGIPPVESCGGLIGGPPVDCGGPAPAPVPVAGPPPPPDPRVVAQQVLARLEIPAPTAYTGPDHTRNEWQMMVVGYPVWLWTTGPDSYTTTVTEQGLTMTLTARRTTTEFRLGDGTTKFCGRTTPYNNAVQPGARSPSCDHVYQKPSKPGSYQISATTHWQVTWSALGQTGTLPFQRTGPTTELPVGELVSVRVRD
ncbi:hypothetical protein C8D81_0774 [Enemella evansiae]|nr:hypothetical protein C8D81_0774 [Enemella evansiae]